MHRPALLALALLPAFLAPAALAEEHPAGDGIRWAADLPAAIAAAKTSKKPVMICVNAKHVDGRADEEPAAKGLREAVYRDPAVVRRAKDFEMVFLTPQGGAAEYAPLRALGIAGAITSPQHIFLTSAGDRVLLRKAYWSHGVGEKAVTALLAMMDEAEAAASGKAPAMPAEGPAAPADGEERARWIAAQVGKVKAGGEEREGAAWSLTKEDRGGDCVNPLLAILEEEKKDVSLLVPVLRALGRDGLEAAALPVSEFLSHRDETVRGNAAVTLEYIGSRDEKVVVAISKLAAKERNESIANHAWRALGRCGSKKQKVGAMLLNEAASARSEFASYGPCIGLAYFQGDVKAARGVEKLLKQIGVPGGRRGGGGEAVKRGVVSWTLASIGDYDSGKFVEEELLDGLKNVKAFWVPGLKRFWESTAAACQGQEGALAEVEAGVKAIVGFVRGGGMERDGAETRTLTDAFRKGRESAGFKPKGDGLLDYEGE